MFVHFDESIFILFVACFECTSFEETSHFDCEVVEIWEQASTSSFQEPSDLRWTMRCEFNHRFFGLFCAAAMQCSNVNCQVFDEAIFSSKFLVFLEGSKNETHSGGGGRGVRTTKPFSDFFDILLYLYYNVGDYWVMQKISVKMKILLDTDR